MPSPQPKQDLIGNWGFLDEKLNSLWPYTELYFNDSIYAIQNELIGTMAFNYWIVDDTIYRANEVTPKMAIALIKTQSKDSVVLLSENRELTLVRIEPTEKGYFEYGVLGNPLNTELYKRDFEHRAIRFYISKGRFQSKDEYLEFKAELEANTMMDDFED